MLRIVTVSLVLITYVKAESEFTYDRTLGEPKYFKLSGSWGLYYRDREYH